MIGQHYSIRSPDGDTAPIGAFVYKSNSDDELIGFVYDSYGDIAEMVLFEPMELPKNYIEMLYDAIALRASEDIKQMWAKACFPELY
jgi:hypothetical protein